MKQFDKEQSSDLFDLMLSLNSIYQRAESNQYENSTNIIPI